MKGGCECEGDGGAACLAWLSVFRLVDGCLLGFNIEPPLVGERLPGANGEAFAALPRGMFGKPDPSGGGILTGKGNKCFFFLGLESLKNELDDEAFACGWTILANSSLRLSNEEARELANLAEELVSLLQTELLGGLSGDGRSASPKATFEIRVLSVSDDG